MLEFEELETLVNTGWEHFNADRYEEALRDWLPAIESDPENANLHYSMGYALREIGRLGEAHEHYQTAIRLDPSYASAYYGVIFIRTHLLAGRYTKTDLREIRDLCRQVLQLDSLEASYKSHIQRILSDVERKLGKWAKANVTMRQAIATMRQAMELDPDNIENYWTLCSMQRSIGDFIGFTHTVQAYMQHPKFDAAMCAPCAQCKRRMAAVGLLALGGILLAWRLRRKK